MKYTYQRGFLWLLIYTLLSLTLLSIAMSGTIPEHRSFWIELGVAFGFIGLAMFGLQFLFTGRFKKIAPTFGMDNIIQFHREVGIVAFIFVLAHPVTLLLANPDFLIYFDPNANAMRAIALSFVSIAIILLISTSLWRVSFGLDYEKWRLIHGLLALSIVFIGIVHSIQVSHYLEPLWKKASIAILMGVSMYLVFHTRLVRPWKNRKKPYKIIEVKQERGKCWTIVLEPIGHKKMRYVCGQFTWITINSTPFSLQQHPFSIASSVSDQTISLTTKELGDFTSSWKNIQPGSKAYLEGPFGSFTPEVNKHLFLVMGGIGITPAMSMLRTMRDTKDPRKVILIYGNNNWEDVTFREELEEISKSINLQLIHLLTQAPKDWKGETGKVDQAFLKKYLPERPDDYMYFICGPKPLMDIAEISFRNLGISWKNIYSERFEIV
ncbi:MAG: ferric reductase-like transmembrane domain-containing protein [Bacteroidota bacterium]|nr:ferric reductase-like transmembrane domain-containing protein [Bacteroidota bacterium]